MTLGGLAGAAVMLLPTTYETRGKLVLSSTVVSDEDFRKAVLSTKEVRKLAQGKYTGNNSQQFFIPSDLELRIRSKNGPQAKKTLSDLMSKIKVEARQSLIEKYEGERAAIELSSKKLSMSDSQLITKIWESDVLRLVQLELAFAEMNRQEAVMELWLLEPEVQFPKPNIVIGGGLLAGAIIGTFLNLIGRVGRRYAPKH